MGADRLARPPQDRLSVTAPDRRRFVRYDTRTTIELVARGQRHRCETDDLGAGGCRVTLPFTLEKGTSVEVRLTASGTPLVAHGGAVVAWATHGEPCRLGIAFSDAVAEQVIPLMQALLGAVPLEHEVA
jgi:hypothetical protein